MKKTVLLLTMFIQGLNAFGQTYSTSPYTVKSISDGWYNLGQTLIDNHGNSTKYDNPLSPVQGLWDANGYPVWKSVSGQTFDPYDPTWDYEANAALVPGTPYLIDSVSITYGYYRFEQNAADTIVVQVYLKDSMYATTSPLTTVRTEAIPYYSPTTKLGVGAVQTIVIPLTNNDTTAYDEVQFLNIPINQNVPADDVIGITVSYFPGNSLTAGDTLSFASANFPINKRNTFALFTFYDDNNAHVNNFYNHTLFQDVENSWPAIYDDKYKSGTTGWGSIMLQSDIYFHLVDNLGLEESESLTISTYPSPAKDELHVKGLEGLFNYAIYDLQGKQVQKGSTSFTSAINIADLKSGQYVLQINKEEEIQKLRFSKE